MKPDFSIYTSSLPAPCTMIRNLLTVLMVIGGISKAIAAPPALPDTGTARKNIQSPGGEIHVDFRTAEKSLQIHASYKGKPVVEKIDIAWGLGEGTILGESATVLHSTKLSSDAWVEPAVPQKAARLHDRYEGLRVDFSGDYSLEIRVYDFGFAYRLVTSHPDDIDVITEHMNVRFPSGTTSWFPEETSMVSHNERLYLNVELDSLDATRLASLPLMMQVPDVARVLFSEADLFDYPGMYVHGGDGPSIIATFPRYPLETVPTVNPPLWPDPSDRNITIVREAPYIARTSGTRTFPWRAFVISDDDGTFLETDFVYLLSRPQELEDTSWIEPGQIAWDWYNALNLTGVDFQTGINNRTYEYYIDFASKYGIRYVILDEGWSVSTYDITQSNPDIDIPHLVQYGTERGVGIILWALWGPLETDAENIYSLYQQWGVKGVKIDFMQHSNQKMVNFYTETAKLAAKYKLLVDFHGSFKPSGLRRAWPNVMTYEGIRGSENNKWISDVTPAHNVTIPFIRMAVGPMDYTPGSMTNVKTSEHRIIIDRPMTMGTRSHEVAKYVVYESALQMLCDTPSNYYREDETTRFISSIPTVWDETHALSNAVGQYVSVARRKGDIWYIGAMNNDQARSLDLDLSALPKGSYSAVIFRDGINAERHAGDYRLTRQVITGGKKLQIHMASGGGWSAILQPLESEEP